jgi:magnesium-transporting ATPase (P-type)
MSTPTLTPSVAVPATIESLPIDAVWAALDTRPDGLTAAEAAARATTYGPNLLSAPPRRSLFRRVSAHFTHLMALLLWAGGVLALAAGLPALCIAIVLVNIINGAFSFWQEHRADQATEALRQLLPVHARVLRDGAELGVLAEALVPGDVLLLEEGDRISADARVVLAAELHIDQSTLTGETNATHKTAEPSVGDGGNRANVVDLVFAGTNVAAGRGRAVVIATGMRTEFGRIATLTQTMDDHQSPLQRELGHLSKVVTVMAVSVGLLLAAIAVAIGVMGLTEGLVFGLGMIVAFVPEGLLPTVTLSLAMATQRMARRNALVKRLSAVETLGSTTVICTDKTGTLTENEMTVREAFLLSGAVTFEGVGYAPDGAMHGVEPSSAAAGDVTLLLTAGALACNARLLETDGRWTVLGDPTEAAVEVAGAKAGIDLVEAARLAPRVYELPFDARRMRMSTVHAAADGQVLYTKGAPSETLELCVQARVDGADVPLDDALRARIVAANDDMARRGLRVLAVARRALGGETVVVDDEHPPEWWEHDLTFFGLLAMMDPPRPEVTAAVAKCHAAGIRTVMITGDYGLTGESIARQVGLLEGPDVRIVTGDELSSMSAEDLDAVVRGEVLFARASPEHKLRIVTALQAQGHVVAVTGDGVNDAPALKKADIGVAMGRSGTDVAREAADVILLDDNFASIVSAVEEGRAVYANIRRFTSYIFTSNAPEAVPFTVFALSGGRIPLALGVMAILSIDLGTDLVPALALGAEPPDQGVMDRPPRAQSAHLVTRSLLGRAYLTLGGASSVAVMVVFFGWFWAHGHWGHWLDLPDTGALYHQAVSMALTAVVFTQIGNLFAQRATRSTSRWVWLFSNRLVWVGIASELAVVALIVYVPFLQHVFDTGSLPAWAWLWFIPLIPLLPLVDGLAARSSKAARLPT